MNIHLDLARGQKKLWNMRLTVILVVVSALGMAPKEIGGIDQRKDQNHSDHNNVDIG